MNNNIPKKRKSKRDALCQSLTCALPDSKPLFHAFNAIWFHELKHKSFNLLGLHSEECTR